MNMSLLSNLKFHTMNSINNIYKTPAIHVVEIDFHGTMMAVSLGSPILEDFDVSDGEW